MALNIQLEDRDAGRYSVLKTDPLATVIVRFNYLPPFYEGLWKDFGVYGLRLLEKSRERLTQMLTSLPCLEPLSLLSMLPPTFPSLLVLLDIGNYIKELICSHYIFLSYSLLQWDSYISRSKELWSYEVSRNEFWTRLRCRHLHQKHIEAMHSRGTRCHFKCGVFLMGVKWFRQGEKYMHGRSSRRWL